MTQTYGLHYWTKIEFKDNKMRISAPIIKALQMGAFKVEGTNAFVTNHKIFVKGKPGKSKQAVEAREAMTKLLNDTISEIINPTNNSEW